MRLPPKVAAKQAVVNPENTDEKCFKWCLGIALNPLAKNPQRISRAVMVSAETLNWEGIEFPVKLSEITKFQKNNPGISVNVFGFKKSVYPLRISKVERTPVDLLLISDGEKQHFCPIWNLSQLLSGQLNSHEHKKFVCRRCLNPFTSQKKLDEHSELCSKKDFVKIEIDGGTVKFKNFKRREKVPFIVYGDFECLNQLVNSLKGRTQQYQKHKPSGFCFQIACGFDEKIQFEPVLFRATSEEDDVGQIFVEKLEQKIKQLFKRFNFRKKMIFTKEDKKGIRRSNEMLDMQR